MATAKIPKSALRFSDELHVEFAEDDSKKASMLAYSGKPMRHPLFGNLVVDVSGIKFQSSRIPILEDHEEDKKIGFSGKPSTENNIVQFDDITLLDNEVAQEFYKNAAKGFPYQASISFYPKKVEKVEEGASAEVNGFTQKGPAIIFRESMFRESSVVTFGMDHRTSSIPQSEDTVSVVLSDSSAEILNSYFRSETADEDNDNSEDFASLDNPRTPTYNETETSPSWGDVDKSFQGYKKAFGYGDADWNDWNDAPSDFRKKAAATSFAGDANAETFDKGVYYPAVNPSTKNLNKDGVLAAERYAKQNGHTKVANKARSLYDKEFGEKEQKEHDMSEEIQDYQNKLKEYEQKLAEYDQRFEQMQRDKTQTELSQKLGEENVAFVMKFYDKLSPEELHEVADKIKQLHDIVNELGQSKGSESGGGDDTQKEPAFAEIQKYAQDHGLSFMDATKEIYKQRQSH